MNKKVKKSVVVIPLEKDKESKTKFSINEMGNKSLWIFTAILAAIYFVFSFFSNGFYMHDEPCFYLYAKDFWDDPITALQGFQRLGYVLSLTIPSLGGFKFLHFFNSAMAAITVMYSYKIVHKLGGKNSFLIFFLIGLQPLWFMLAFRNYSEFFIAFLLVMTAWNHFNKKYIYAALLLSYAAFSRQEYHSLLGFYFLVLVFKKQWVPALLTGTFTVVHNLIGYIITDDIFYLYSRIKEYDSSISEAYPRRGFDYYYIMSNVVFGAVSLVLFINYIGVHIIKKKMPNLFLLIPVIFIFSIYCIFNHETWKIGVGGGNLRYIIPIAPLLAILGVLSIDEVIGFAKKYLLLIFLLPLAMLIGIYQTYDHDFMKLFEDGDRYWLPLFLAIATILVLILPLKPKHYLPSLAILSVILIISSARTFELNSEDATMKKAGQWFGRYLDQSKSMGDAALFDENSRITSGHILLFYYANRYRNDFINTPVIDITKEVSDTLKKGDLVIWDSHYGYRPKIRPTSQPYDYYDNNPDYEKIQYYQSKDRRFLIAFFRKIKD